MNDGGLFLHFSGCTSFSLSLVVVVVSGGGGDIFLHALCTATVFLFVFCRLPNATCINDAANTQLRPR
jgi:FtsH-binding integral membrane protein